MDNFGFSSCIEVSWLLARKTNEIQETLVTFPFPVCLAYLTLTGWGWKTNRSSCLKLQVSLWAASQCTGQEAAGFCLGEVEVGVISPWMATEATSELLWRQGSESRRASPYSVSTSSIGPLLNPGQRPEAPYHPFLWWGVLWIFVHWMKVYWRDWCNKTLNIQ